MVAAGSGDGWWWWWGVLGGIGGDPHLHYESEEGPTLGVRGGECPVIPPVH